MNVHQKIVLSTGLVFIIFIVILALVDFNNVIMALGLLAVIAVVSGTVKVLLLNEKRKAVHQELLDYQKSLERQKPKKAKKAAKFEYYCPLCLYQSHTKSAECPGCGKVPLVKTVKTKDGIYL